MENRGIQISLTALIVLVACFALNLWLFRYGAIWGFVGLNISKHIIIAYLCQIVGVNRRLPASPTDPRDATVEHSASPN
ncbi:MAG: hypothetical protein SFX72_10395 [Isosphaeraceae bacterium]|nr:hypothetical protein [Isosphaeraceae bacterium]